MLAPYQLASAGMKRCISPYRGMDWMISRRYALKVVPKSWMGTPDSMAIRELAMLEGMRRSSKLSPRSERHPETTS